MKFTLSILALLVSAVSAQAASITLISLKSEAMPGKTAYLGINTNSANQITGVFYKGVNGGIESFSSDQLLNYKQVLFEKKGYKLVTMKATSASANSMTLSLNYLRNALTGDSSKRVFKVRYNKNMNQYELNDENGRYVSKAYVTTNHNLMGMEVGIDEFQTQ